MADFNLSVLSQASGVDLDGVLAEVLDSALRTSGEAGRWQVRRGGVWSAVEPREPIYRGQGWKLHMSATPASADAVLARALPVLLAGRSPFKFASTIDLVAELNARHTPRGHSGKFLTIYPQSDAEAARLAEALHQETAGLPGPRILSDRPYAPGSLVHYRYGAFVEERRLGNDGLYAWVIFDPEGNPVEDRRIGQYLPPAWAPCPFPQSAAVQPVASGTTKGDGVLLGDRFLVREAIRHVNKGGVYRAVDTKTGVQAIIKEARPHVAANAAGQDVRDLLRAEARALDRIEPFGAAPRMLKLFEHSEHLFLAEEFVPGVALQQWVLDRIRHNGWRRNVPGAVQMAERLVELLDRAHRAGVLVRDFTPPNVMVLPDGQLRLIDLELAVLLGEQDEAQTGAGTHGYAAPEQMAGAPAAVEADYYSLGANICFVLTGATPDLPEDLPQIRPLRERLAEWLAVRKASSLPDDVPQLILGLMDAEPERRWTVTEARNALANVQQSPGRADSPDRGDVSDSGGSGDQRLNDDQWYEAVDGMVGHLLDSMDPTDDERLWPASCAQGAPDPCILQLGAAGVLGVLTRCFQLTADSRLSAAIDTAGRWISRRLGADADRPPGLYFGAAGIAWALHDAGRVLDDEQLVEQGLTLARTLPASSPNPDVTHGTAGIGLALLHLWHRSGDEELLKRAAASADMLVASAADGPDGLIWGTPAAFESRLAGGRYYGFAHGTAGVGHFLLAAALATGRPDLLDLACQAGETLLATATLGEGTAQWGPGPGDETTAPFWCHGSAGIGSFLTRLHRATGDDRYDKLAHMSAAAVMENAWRGVFGQCHGLAGNGEFLLDMADAGDAERYVAMAHQLARIIFASRACRNGRIMFPDEERGFSVMWADGASGILSFLLRLRHRSPRLWMVDPLLERGQSR